jgi:NAD(P) transhydrogenase subunit alpha
LTYAKNIANFVALLVQDGQLHPEVDDDIVRQTVTAADGQVVNARVRELLGLEPLPAPPPPPAASDESTTTTDGQ